MARARAAAAAPVSLRAAAVSLLRCCPAVRRDFVELRHACVHTRPRQRPSSNRAATTHQCLARLLASGRPAPAIIGLNRAGVVDAVSTGCSLEKPHLFAFQIRAAPSLPVQFLAPESIHGSCLPIQTTSSLSRPHQASAVHRPRPISEFSRRRSSRRRNRASLGVSLYGGS